MKRLIDRIEQKIAENKETKGRPDALLINEQDLDILIREFAKDSELDEEVVRYTFEQLGYYDLTVIVCPGLASFKLVNF